MAIDPLTGIRAAIRRNCKDAAAEQDLLKALLEWRSVQITSGLTDRDLDRLEYLAETLRIGSREDYD